MNPSADSPLKPATGATILVVDAKPLSLLATAGVLHYEGMRCWCARDATAAIKACGLDFEQEMGSPGQVRIDSGADRWTPGDAIDATVWDVGEDPALTLETLDRIRQSFRYRSLPAVLLAEPVWSGLEKKTERLSVATHCLFKPIDPRSLATIVSQLLWMPSLQSAHRTRGGRPTRPGWITL